MGFWSRRQAGGPAATHLQKHLLQHGRSPPASAATPPHDLILRLGVLRRRRTAFASCSCAGAAQSRLHAEVATVVRAASLSLSERTAFREGNVVANLWRLRIFRLRKIEAATFCCT